MCEYCKVDERGDIASEYLIFEEVELEEEADFKSGNGVFNCKVAFGESLKLATQISGNTGILSFMAWIEDDVESPFDVQKDVKIHYCPMCGRKLGEVDNV